MCTLCINLHYLHLVGIEGLRLILRRKCSLQCIHMHTKYKHMHTYIQHRSTLCIYMYMHNYVHVRVLRFYFTILQYGPAKIHMYMYILQAHALKCISIHIYTSFFNFAHSDKTHTLDSTSKYIVLHAIKETIINTCNLLLHLHENSPDYHQQYLSFLYNMLLSY